MLEVLGEALGGGLEEGWVMGKEKEEEKEREEEEGEKGLLDREVGMGVWFLLLLLLHMSSLRFRFWRVSSRW